MDQCSDQTDPSGLLSLLGSLGPFVIARLPRAFCVSAPSGLLCFGSLGPFIFRLPRAFCLWNLSNGLSPCLWNSSNGLSPNNFMALWRLGPLFNFMATRAFSFISALWALGVSGLFCYLGALGRRRLSLFPLSRRSGP